MKGGLGGRFMGRLKNEVSLEFVLRMRCQWKMCFWALNIWELKFVQAFFSTLLVKLVRGEDNDKVTWEDANKGLFSAESFYSVLEFRSSIIFPMNIISNPLVMPKLSFSVWKAT